MNQQYMKGVQKVLAEFLEVRAMRALCFNEEMRDNSSTTRIYNSKNREKKGPR